MYWENKKLVSYTLTKNGNLEIIVRTPSMMRLANGQAVPDMLEKHIYTAQDGRIVPLKTIKGKVKLPVVTPEEFIFDEDTD